MQPSRDMTPCTFVGKYKLAETYISVPSENKIFYAIWNWAVADCLKSFVTIYQTTRSHIPADGNLDNHCHNGSKPNALVKWWSIVPFSWQDWALSRLQLYSLEHLTGEQYRIRYNEDAAKLIFFKWSYFKNKHLQNFWTSAAHADYSYPILTVNNSASSSEKWKRFVSETDFFHKSEIV